MAATLDFACGAECGIATVGAAPVGPRKHWDVVTGNVTISTAWALAPGIRSHRFQAAGSPADLRKIFSAGTPTVGVFREYFVWPTLPNITVNIVGFMTASGSFCGVRYNSTGTKLEGVAVTTPSATGVVVVPGQMYRIEGRATVGATPLVLDWSVDGVEQDSVSAGTLSTIDNYRIGIGVTGSPAVTGEMFGTAHGVSLVSGDYPVGPGCVVALWPISDGTHSYNGAGDFTFDGVTNIGLGATTTWDSINDLLDNITTFLGISGAAAAEYLEWLFTSLPAADSVRHVELVSAHHSATAAANKQSFRLVDGGSTSDPVVDADYSQTTLCHSSVPVPVPPTGGSWSKAKVDGLKLRWTSSFTSALISPVPYLDAVCLEVEFVPTAAQTLVPNATLAAGGWVDQVGAAVDLHSPLADEDPATYVQSPANPANAILKLGLTDISTPSAGEVTIEVDAEQV